MLAAGHVDQPGMLGQQTESTLVEQPCGLVREREREEHHVGRGQQVVQVVERGCGRTADDTGLRAERFEQSDERLGDAATPDDRDLRAEEVAALRALPRRRTGVGPHAPQTHEREQQRMLGDGFGVPPLAAGPDPVGVEDGHERLDPRPRQLHPGDVGLFVEQRAEAVRTLRVGPDHGLRGPLGHRGRATRLDRGLEPGASGADEDARHGSDGTSGSIGTERASSPPPSNDARTTASLPKRVRTSSSTWSSFR